MRTALGLLVVLGVLVWFTMDPRATLHVRGYQSGWMSIEDRDIPMRWIPEFFLGLFGFRIVMAYMRARLEAGKSGQG